MRNIQNLLTNVALILLIPGFLAVFFLPNEYSWVGYLITGVGFVCLILATTVFKNK